jgi:hypothetical protein
MELDQKIRYAAVAFAVASIAFAALGLHLGSHFATHLRVLERGGASD